MYGERRIDARRISTLKMTPAFAQGGLASLTRSGPRLDSRLICTTHKH
jgi:hypothetical protein